MLLGITFSPVKDLKRWHAEVGLDNDLLCDADRSVAMAYGAATSPDQEKAARVAVLVGADGKVRQAYEVSDAAGHAGAALTAL